MARFFTYGWQFTEARKAAVQGEPLRYAAGSRFTRHGIRPGDFVYVMAIHKKKLYVVGKMQVAKIVGRSEARRILGAEPYDAAEHLIASACTPARITEVPGAVAKELRFVGGGKKRIAFRDGDAPDPQSMRVIRELDTLSAACLNELVEEMTPYNWPAKP